MKKMLIMAGILATVFSSCNSGSTSLKTEEDSLAYAFGVNFGLSLKQFDSTVNVDIVADAAKAAFKGGASMDGEEALAFIQEYIMVRKPKKVLAASQKFLSEKGQDPNVKKTESGLLYEIIEEGGEKPTQDIDTVWVNYKGMLPDGTVFDQRADTISFPLNRVIAGWTEGMKLVGKGGKIKLYVPSELAYGQQGNRGISPNQALVFEIEMIDFAAGDSSLLKK